MHALYVRSTQFKYDHIVVDQCRLYYEIIIWLIFLWSAQQVICMYAVRVLTTISKLQVCACVYSYKQVILSAADHCGTGSHTPIVRE